MLSRVILKNKSSITKNMTNIAASKLATRNKSIISLSSTTTEYPKGHTTANDEPYLTPSFVNNEFIKSESDTWFDIHDPATNNVVSKVHNQPLKNWKMPLLLLIRHSQNGETPVLLNVKELLLNLFNY